MATNIDKALFQQPQGIDALAEDEQGIEIEIVDPESVSIEGPGFAIELAKVEAENDFGANLAEEMDESAIGSMAGDLADDIDNDRNSRKEWEKAYTEGLKLLGLQVE